MTRQTTAPLVDTGLTATNRSARELANFVRDGMTDADMARAAAVAEGGA